MDGTVGAIVGIIAVGFIISLLRNCVYIVHQAEGMPITIIASPPPHSQFWNAQFIRRLIYYRLVAYLHVVNWAQSYDYMLMMQVELRFTAEYCIHARF